MKYSIEFYEKIDGTQPFYDWLNNQDAMIRYQIIAKLGRMELGNLGNSKFLDNGISEIKLDIGPGFRIYYSKIGLKVILLLSAGIKRTQQKDIEKALQYLKDYKQRGKRNGKK